MGSWWQRSSSRYSGQERNLLEEVTLKLKPEWWWEASLAIISIKVLNAGERAGEKALKLEYLCEFIVCLFHEIKVLWTQVPCLLPALFTSIPEVLSGSVDRWKECAGYSKCSVNICWTNKWIPHNRIDCFLLKVPTVLYTLPLFYLDTFTLYGLCTHLPLSANSSMRTCIIHLCFPIIDTVPNLIVSPPVHD